MPTDSVQDVKGLWTSSNIRSINPDTTAPRNDDGKPVKPIIRRALTLRGQIMVASLFANHDGCKIANVDDDILYALLTIDKYRHGARSMEAILQMCTPIDERIEKASLPSRAQLNMHVNAEEFFIRVQRGRFRSSVIRDQTESEQSELEPPDKPIQPHQAPDDNTGISRILPTTNSDTPIQNNEVKSDENDEPSQDDEPKS